MSNLNIIEWIKGEAPAWLLSLAIHAAILVPLAFISWVVASGVMPDRVLTLQTAPQLAGVDEQGVDSPGSAGGGDGSPGPVTAKPAAEKRGPDRPAPLGQPLAIEASVGELLPGDLPTSTLTAPAGATDGLMQSMTRLSESTEPRLGSGGPAGLGKLLDGTSRGFGDYIGSLRGSGLDIVLVLDATNSMSPYINQAKERLREILDVVLGLVPNARFGVVAYKDYGDDYGPKAVKFIKITADVKVIRAAIDDIVAGGGGDLPEPINEALKIATDERQMGWLGGRKRVIILVGDSPIHASGREAAFKEALEFAKEMRGAINVIDAGGTGDQESPRANVQPDLSRIAAAGGGSAFLLQDTALFWRHLIISVFGERFKNDVDVIIDKFVHKKP